jgi:hypothetical protein
VCGFNPFSKDGEDVINEDMRGLEKEIEKIKDEHSNGIDRVFPFGPACIFNDIKMRQDTGQVGETEFV